MKISENKLRKVIKNVLNEMSEESYFFQEDHHDLDHQEYGHQEHGHQEHGHQEIQPSNIHIDMAHKCCQMSKDKLMKMCAKICMVMPERVKLCCDLYDCASRGDVDGCCRCLEDLCKCPVCCSICSECCGC